MKLRTQKIILVIFLLLQYLQLFSQPCAPIRRHFNQQFLLNQECILLINTCFNGDRMGGWSVENNIQIGYVIVNNGKVVKDSFICLDWPGYTYNFDKCKSFYSVQEVTMEKFDYTSCTDCFEFNQFISNDQKPIFEFQLKNDVYRYWIDLFDSKKPSTKLFSIKNDSNYILEKMDYREYLDKYSSNSFTDTTGLCSKNGKSVITILSEKMYQKMKDSTLLSIKQLSIKESKNNYKIRIENFTFLVYEITSKSKQKTIISGENWKIVLNGSLFYLNQQPLLSYDKKNRFLYVTVFNNESISCTGYGNDITPLLYCIDLKNKKMIHKTNI